MNNVLRYLATLILQITLIHLSVCVKKQFCCLPAVTFVKSWKYLMIRLCFHFFLEYGLLLTPQFKFLTSETFHDHISFTLLLVISAVP